MPEKVEHILCAVRGSPQSRATVTHAIDLALEHEARLTFFYAIDIEFLSRTTAHGPISVVYNELIEMSEFTMLILKDRAERRGVTQVDSIIREGEVRTQLLEVVHQARPEIVILGWPLRGAGKPRFMPDELKAFAAELEREGNLRVEVTPPPHGT